MRRLAPRRSVVSMTGRRSVARRCRAPSRSRARPRTRWGKRPWAAARHRDPRSGGGAGRPVSTSHPRPCSALVLAPVSIFALGALWRGRVARRPTQLIRIPPSLRGGGGGGLRVRGGPRRRADARDKGTSTNRVVPGADRPGSRRLDDQAVDPGRDDRGWAHAPHHAPERRAPAPCRRARGRSQEAVDGGLTAQRPGRDRRMGRARVGGPPPRPAQHPGRGNHRARCPRQTVGRGGVTGGGRRTLGCWRAAAAKQPVRFRWRRNIAAAPPQPPGDIIQPSVDHHRAPRPRPARTTARSHRRRCPEQRRRRGPPACRRRRRETPGRPGRPSATAAPGGRNTGR